MQPQSAAPAAISLSDVIGGVMRRKLFVLGTTALAFAGSLAYVNLAKPQFSSVAQVIVENLASPYDRAQGPDEAPRAEPFDERMIQSQVSVLTSRDLALRVIQLLNLQEREEFKGLKDGNIGALKSILVALGFAPDPRLMTAEERALLHYYDGLSVYQVPESSVIALEFSGRDAATAAELLNTLTSQYVAETAETRLKPTMRAREWLAQQIADLRGKVTASEQTVEQYRSQAGLLKGETSTLNNQDLTELNRQITAAETARTDAEERAKSIRNMLDDKGTVDDAIDVLNSPIIQRLREQQVTAAGKVAELSATYLSSHPKMIAAQNELRNVERQLRREALKIVDSLQEQAKIAAGRQAALSQRLQQIKNIASNANIDEVKLKELERNAAADRALLESLLLRYADASARQDAASQPAMARIIQQASASSIPSFPRKGPTVLLISLAALLLSLGLAFLMEIMAAASRVTQHAGLPGRQDTAPEFVPEPVQAEPRFAAASPSPRQQHEEADITARVAAATGATVSEKPPAPMQETARKKDQQAPPPASPVSTIRTNAPLAIFSLGSTVLANQEMLRAAASVSASPLQMSANSVADWVLATASKDQLKRIAIVSVGTGSTVSAAATVAVARAVSSRGKRVMMLDLTPAEVGSHTLAGLASGPGLVDLLTGKADFTGIVARDTASSSHIVRFGMNTSPAAMAMLSGKLDQILQTLNGIYDVVFVNAGELSSSAQIMAGKVQAALLLAPAVRQQEVAMAVQALKASGMNAVEFVALVQGADASGLARATA
jgi:uncharacterized protein involved in exopolysaccharide biosynthesis/Mrp family chromosome partitioning ATPase